MNEFKDKKVAVLGLGIEGTALANFLFDQVASITVFDQKNESELLECDDEHLQLSLKTVFDNNKIEKKLRSDIGDISVDDFDIIFRSPSVYFNHPKLVEAREKGIEVSSQIKLFMELCPCKIIGVTGTKGKGTTASLIAGILIEETRNKKQETKGNVYLAGNIGYPAISLIPQLTANDVVVLELSNFQLADMQKSPQISVVTNLDVDHLDYHKNISEYHDAKKSILAFQDKSDFAVLNINSSFDRSFIGQLKSKISYFSSSANENAAAYVREADGKNAVFLKGDDGREELVCTENDIKLLGRHNLENIAAAAIVGNILGVDNSTISEAVKNTAGLPYRLEFVAEIEGVRYINDSFATNPRPTIAAIRSFKNNKILILGGSPKGADFKEMAKVISDSNVMATILIGVEASKIESALKEADYCRDIFSGFSELKDALLKAKDVAKRGDIVVFSPACASFDMFKNYKDRGAKFNQAVADLENSK